MISTPDTMQKFFVQVTRQDKPDSDSYRQTFELTYKPNLNVISCLQAIAANPVTTEGKSVEPIVWDCNCLEEVCGACTMVINGRVRQSCSTLVDTLIHKEQTGTRDTPIQLAPMSKFPVIRDLFVDRGRMFENLKRIQGWVPIDGTHQLTTVPDESPDRQEERYNLSRCMTCGCCLEACPQFQRDNQFVGAQVIGQTLYFNEHKTGAQLKDERLTTLEQAGGISDCGNSQNCVQVCPKEIPLTEAIAKIGRQVTIHSFKQFFAGKS